MKQFALIEAVRILGQEFKRAFPELSCLPLDLPKDLSVQLYEQLKGPDFNEMVPLLESKDGKDGPYQFKLESVELLVFIGSPFKKGTFTTVQNFLFANIVDDLSAGKAVDYGAIEKALGSCVFESGVVWDKV